MPAQLHQPQPRRHVRKPTDLQERGANYKCSSYGDCNAPDISEVQKVPINHTFDEYSLELQRPQLLWIIGRELIR